MGARILVINNDAELEGILRSHLEAENVQVVTVSDETDVNSELEGVAPDLIVLNAPLAELPGIEWCRRLRARSDTKAILILLLTDDTSDTLESLAAGADDHLTKPFSVPELVARIQALLRRIRPSSLAAVLKIGSIELDRETMRVWRAGRLIRIGLSGYRLLEFLMERVGRLFTREQLIEGLWGNDAGIDVRTVDVHIGRLRAVLNRGRERDPIRTVRGTGYAFDDRFTASPELSLRKRRLRQTDPDPSRDMRGDL